MTEVTKGPGSSTQERAKLSLAKNGCTNLLSTLQPQHQKLVRWHKSELFFVLGITVPSKVLVRFLSLLENDG